MLQAARRGHPSLPPNGGSGGGLVVVTLEGPGGLVLVPRDEGLLASGEARAGVTRRLVLAPCSADGRRLIAPPTQGDGAGL